MLWISIIISIPAHICLALDHPESDQLLKAPPRRNNNELEEKEKYFTTRSTARNVGAQSLFSVALIFIAIAFRVELFGIDFERDDPLYASADDVKYNAKRGWTEGEPTAKVTMSTIVFTILVFLQVFGMLNARKINTVNVLSGLCSNFSMIACAVIMVGAQLVCVTLFGRYMQVVPLSWDQIGMCALLASSSIVYAALGKFLPAGLFLWIK